MGATPALPQLPGRLRTRGVCLWHPTLWNGVTSRQQTLAPPPLSPAPLGRLFARLKSVGLAAGIGENVLTGTSLWLVRHGITGGSRGRALQTRVRVVVACGVYFGHHPPRNLSLWPPVVTHRHSTFAHFWENQIVLCVSDPDSPLVASRCPFLPRGSGILPPEPSHLRTRKMWNCRI